VYCRENLYLYFKTVTERSDVIRFGIMIRLVKMLILSVRIGHPDFPSLEDLESLSTRKSITPIVAKIIDKFGPKYLSLRSQ
jgi:hypothetical protein